MTAPGGRWKPAPTLLLWHSESCLWSKLDPLVWEGSTRGGGQSPSWAEGSSPCPRAPYPSARPLGGRARACRGCGRDSGVMPSPVGPRAPKPQGVHPSPPPSRPPHLRPCQEQVHEKKAGFMGLVEYFRGVCPTSEIVK